MALVHLCAAILAACLLHLFYRWLKHQVVHFYQVASSPEAAPVTWAKLTVAFALSAQIIYM
jgi:hypothetical protein